MNRLLRFLFRRMFEYDVFVAYDHVDTDFLIWLEQRLTESGYDVVYDSKKLVSGYRLTPQITRLIRQSYGGIVLESQESQDSQFVTSEVTYLLRTRRNVRPLIPVLLRVPVRESLRDLLWVDFRGIDIKDPRDAERRETKFVEIVRGLRGEDPSDTGHVGLDPPWRARGFSLKLVCALAVIALLLMTIVFQSLASRVGGALTGSTIESRQQRVLAKERTIDAQFAPPFAPPSFTGTTQHFEKGPGSPMVAVDTWESGRLVQRDFFDDGRRIARDRLDYNPREAIGKVRTYFDEQGREILYDTFSQDGLLIGSRYCRDGSLSACVSEGGQVRSPLPPIVILRYR